jgi:hypothetical protein
VLEVLGQTTVAAQVGESALHHPTARLDSEADLGRRGTDDGHPPAEGGLDPVLETALVGTIRPELLDAWKLLVGTHQQIEAAIPILLVSRMDVDALLDSGTSVDRRS